MISDEQAILILAYVKGIWQDQATDQFTTEAWLDVLQDQEFGDVIAAIRDRARAGLERPSAAELCADALRVRYRRLDIERARRKPIEYMRSEEERAAGRAQLQEIIEQLSKKLSK